MSSPVFTTTNTGIQAVDSDSPNTTEPSELRTFPGQSGKDTHPSSLYAVPIGGGITLQVWGYFAQLKRWAKIGAATACADDTVTTIATPPVGTPKLYAQVTVNTACTQYSIGFKGAR